MKNIILIGFMGTGKSTVGKLIAEQLELQYIEMDDLIVEKSGKSIPTIFKEQGEERFRELEISVAKDLSEISDSVISTGGGVVLNQINIQYLRKNGNIVLLEAGIDEIYSRIMLEGKEKRPLLDMPDPKGEIKSMLSYRRPFYNASADFKVSTRKKLPEQVADEIIEAIEIGKTSLQGKELGVMFNKVSDILLPQSQQGLNEAKSADIKKTNTPVEKKIYDSCVNYELLDPLKLLNEVDEALEEEFDEKTAKLIVPAVIITVLRNYTKAKGSISYMGAQLIEHLDDSKIALCIRRAMVIPYGCSTFLGISSLSMGVGIAISAAIGAAPKRPQTTHLVNKSTLYALRDLINKNLIIHNNIKDMCESVLISSIKFMDKELGMEFLT